MFFVPARHARTLVLGNALVALACLLVTRSASAHRNGIAAMGCGACHGDSASSTLSVSATPSTIAPGDDVTLSVVIEHPGVAGGGLFVADPGVGQLSALAGEGLAASSAGLTHSAPKLAQNGQVTFRFGWRAPAQPGAVHFEIYGLAANLDGTASGDAPGSSVFSAVFGCTPATFYFDADGDGHGATLFPSTIACVGAPPLGYSPTNDDCDDTRDTVYPGASETCNGRDDNCNGQIDEGTSPEELYPDADGDGYYASKTGPMVLGCLPLAGYAAYPGDCAPLDASRHPGALEICNLLDDNCDGRVDEGVRPQCGVGLCRRESVTCDVADCVAGAPTPEVCDALDNNCDGLVDEGLACASNGGCTGAACTPASAGATNGGSAASSGAGGALPGLSGGAPAGVGAGGAPGGASSGPRAPSPASGGASAGFGSSANSARPARTPSCTLSRAANRRGERCWLGLWIALGAGLLGRVRRRARSRTGCATQACAWTALRASTLVHASCCAAAPLTKASSCSRAR